jgi:hypothetical protein
MWVTGERFDISKVGIPSSNAAKQKQNRPKTLFYEINKLK